ncbi:MAG: hypothetical protein V4550_12320 [Gemmatimonadota bacterium]
MGFSKMIRQPSALAPLIMSLAALATVGLHVARFGTQPQADEGAAAHIWQLLMAAQFFVISYFAIKWFPRAPKETLMMLALHLAAGLAAAAPVFLLGF